MRDINRIEVEQRLRIPEHPPRMDDSRIAPKIVRGEPTEAIQADSKPLAMRYGPEAVRPPQSGGSPGPNSLELGNDPQNSDRSVKMVDTIQNRERRRQANSSPVVARTDLRVTRRPSASRSCLGRLLQCAIL
jgi:hypothetical protein